jgi:hypothetical protein
MRFRLLARQYGTALQATPWLQVFGYAALVLFFGKLLAWLMPAGLRTPFNQVVVVAALLLVIAKDLAGTPQFLQRVRAVSVKGTSWPARIAALFPPEFVALLRLERSLMQGFLNWIARRGPPPRPAGVRLTYLERGAYSTAIAIALFSVFVDIPINMLIVSVIPLDPDHRSMIHLIAGIGAAYSLVWVLGDRWLVRGGGHVLTSTELDLQVGARTAGKIPLAAIAACESVNEKRVQWCKRNGIPVHATLLVSPFDQPNLVLMLKPDSGVRLTHYQMERSDPSYVFLYVDRPGLLAACLADWQRYNEVSP